MASFGTTLLFEVQDQPLCVFHVEICEDLWVPISPSSFAALAGATVLMNLSASNVTVAKESYRRQLVASQSARCLAAYVYSAAGTGESTTDLAWDGQGMIYENGNALAEARRFLDRPQLITGDVDLDRLQRARALVVFPGGYGTFDELFEVLALIQTRKIAPVPVILVGAAYWRRAFDVDLLVDEGVIDPEDRELFWYAETAQEIWDGLLRWHETNGTPLLRPGHMASTSD